MIVRGGLSTMSTMSGVHMLTKILLSKVNQSYNGANITKTLDFKRNIPCKIS